MSWERTIEDLGDALANNPVLKPLNACRHLIVPFSVDGAIWIERAGEDLWVIHGFRRRLVPANLELFALWCRLWLEGKTPYLRLIFRDKSPL